MTFRVSMGLLIPYRITLTNASTCSLGQQGMERTISPERQRHQVASIYKLVHQLITICGEGGARTHAPGINRPKTLAMSPLHQLGYLSNKWNGCNLLTWFRAGFEPAFLQWTFPKRFPIIENMNFQNFIKLQESLGHFIWGKCESQTHVWRATIFHSNR